MRQRLLAVLAAACLLPAGALAQSGGTVGQRGAGGASGSARPTGAGGSGGSPAPIRAERPFSREAVLEVVEAHREQIQACYERAMAARGSTLRDAPRGRVVVAWTITTEGLTAEVRVKKTDIRDELVTDCIVEAIRYWEFPKPERRQPVEFPFDLQPAAAPAGGQKERD